ncbi:uncharacterized protein ARMOST_02803 [Armillaria ostoyae]|uniref:Uncharacterized protein n=1 Tax=Armillaria ostoyae TaxID=47428 RepID=A0A284QSX9_ARMOS|nr:uncharacterized protein ARMOST_02803 [Armillaria ostoyae]
MSSSKSIPRSDVVIFGHGPASFPSSFTNSVYLVPSTASTPTPSSVPKRCNAYQQAREGTCSRLKGIFAGRIGLFAFKISLRLSILSLLPHPVPTTSALQTTFFKFSVVSRPGEAVPALLPFFTTMRILNAPSNAFATPQTMIKEDDDNNEE